MPTSPEALEKKREEVERLRQELINHTDQRFAQAVDESSDIEAATLDAEAARLEAELAEVKRDSLRTSSNNTLDQAKQAMVDAQDRKKAITEATKADERNLRDATKEQEKADREAERAAAAAATAQEEAEANEAARLEALRASGEVQ